MISLSSNTIGPGETIGVYRLTEFIGEGGFAVVWSAWDERLNRVVAIKLIPRHTKDSLFTLGFDREASAISRLEHPHILPLYDFGETPEFRYLVSRYVTGGSLAQRLKRGRLHTHDILRLMTQIASALDYIHKERIVHRDVKPANILLDAQGSPYLADFGLARDLTSETLRLHSGSGTLAYMAPEQLTGGEISDRCDLFSFGMMLYELFAGQLPYESQGAVGLRYFVSGERLPDIRLSNAKLPEGLNEYLWQLTSPTPADRPASALMVMSAITELLLDAEDNQATTAPRLIAKLESNAYRQFEAGSLIEQHLVPWREGQFRLSLTHFVLLDMLLRDLPELVTPEVRSLLLRAALEYEEHIRPWWEKSTDAERQRACWHAIQHGERETCRAALELVVTTAWARKAELAVANAVSAHLLPTSDLTPLALRFLEKWLPTYAAWAPTSGALAGMDDALSALAQDQSPLSARAARLIGTARRTRAALALPTALHQLNPILTVYEAAGSLPTALPLQKRALLLLLLARRQLTRQPFQALRQYMWAGAGSALALALMIYVVFWSYDLIGSARILNTVGLGLLFGLLYGAGVWLARHIAQRLRVAPYWSRTLLGTAVGGLFVAASFGLFHQLVYDDLIEPSVSISSGLLYVAGFAISVGWVPWLQLLLGAAGVAGAFLLPWPNYLDYDIRPPFVFDYDYPEAAVPLALSAALLLAFVTLGYCWRAAFRRLRIARARPANPHSDQPGAEQP